MTEYYPARVLIWGKTYPELSRRYTETVCTGGVLPNGQPVRLYPVPLRYLNDDKNFRLYDWIDIPITKAQDDTRPESFRVKSDAIVRVDYVKPDDHEWAARREVMFKFGGWRFDGMAELKAAEERDGTSLGIVTPGRIEDVRLERKPEAAEKEYNEKMQEIQSQRDLFLPE